jgi:hypothetical protein
VTAADIAARLCLSYRGVTPERVKKAQALAVRSHVQWHDVLDAMTPEQQRSVAEAQA